MSIGTSNDDGSAEVEPALPDTTSRSTVTFGDFEFSPANFDLRRRGETVRLPAQTMRILALLVERSGELVRREEIIEAIWGDTVVDYDQGINNSIRLLRAALEDDAKNPWCIETVPRLGYRFTPPIDVLCEAKPAESLSPVRPAPPKMAIAAAVAAVAVLAVAIFLAVGYGSDRSAGAHDRPLLVVVPFEAAMARSPTQDEIARGLTEDVVRELVSGEAPSIRVIGPGSVGGLLAQGLDPLDAARRVEASHLVTGNVRVGEDRLRVSIQLVRTADGTTSWSESYDVSLSGAMRLERELALRIASALQPRVTRARLPERREVDPRAMEDYLRARYLAVRRTPESQAEAERLLRSALELDPEFGPALVTLAELNLAGAPSEDSVTIARQAVAHALRLDPDDARAHLVRSRIALIHEWDWEGARRHIDTALRLAPGDPLVRMGRATYLSTLGRHDEGLMEMEEALRIDPISAALRGDIAFLHFLAGRPEEAIGSAELLLELDPDSRVAKTLRIESLLDLGRYDEARDAAIALYGSADGGMAESRPALDRLRRASGPDILDAWLGLAASRWESRPHSGTREVVLATIEARRGNNDQALRRLRGAIEQRAAYAPFFAVDPHFSSLRSEKEFRGLIRSIPRS